MIEPIVVNSRVTIPVAAIEIRAVRSSGPGGQNVNKTASKIQMRIDLWMLAGLVGDESHRIRTFLRSRLDGEGRLLVSSQRTREQARNIADASDRVAELLRAALIPPKVRRPTRPTRASKDRRREEKRFRAGRLQDRRIED